MGTAPKPPPKETPASAIKTGDLVLDRYRVIEQIASGGHSVVFRGLDERLSRPVCIKVFSGLGGKSGVGRTSYEHFVQEAFALSRLTHPNTLRIYDFGHIGAKDQEGMPLQVCEFMNGGTLSNVIREQGKQSLLETARVIGAMCAALGEAHALGIVHRDIKPQNILFGAVGSTKLPKLADFGIAKWSADSEQEQSKRAEDTAIVAGQKLAMYSPSWAAPEQLAGQPVSAATDIYSLAVVAIYMLSGKAIFADEDVYAGYKKRRHADDLVKEALAPLGVPKRVIHLFTRALSFDPKKRLSSIEELAREIGAAAEPGAEDSNATRPGAPSEPTEQLHPVTPTTPTPMITPPTGSPTVRPPGKSPFLMASESAVTDPRAVPPTAPTTAPPTSPASVANAAANIPPVVPPHAAPLPPAIPQQPLTPSWQPPQVRTPWMATAPFPSGAPRRLPLADIPQPVADRSVHFVMVTNNVVDLVGGQGKVRVTFIASAAGTKLLHLKGLTCFVAHLGGRPSPAVQLDQPGDIALVTPRAQEIGHIRVANGVADGGSFVFPIGAELVSLSAEDCTDPILFDFGPGSDAYFVYTRGRAIPRTRRR